MRTCNGHSCQSIGYTCSHLSVAVKVVLEEMCQLRVSIRHRLLQCVALVATVQVTFTSFSVSTQCSLIVSCFFSSRITHRIFSRHCRRVSRLWLILLASASLSPVLSVRFVLSLPARSTRHSWEMTMRAASLQHPTLSISQLLLDTCLATLFHPSALRVDSSRA